MGRTVNLSKNSDKGGTYMASYSDFQKISDGRLYDIEDLVKVDTKGCVDCGICCHNIGDLVVLTPYDVYSMFQKCKKSFEALLGQHISLREEKKVLLPYLKMEGEDLHCSFLDEQGRCQIHTHRPNICRLFPLGRIYENDGFKYFLQVNNCVMPHLGEMKVRDWLNIKQYEDNKEMIFEWHQFIKALSFRLKFVYDEEEVKKIQQYVLNTFYHIEAEDDDAFYECFKILLPKAKDHLGLL